MLVYVEVAIWNIVLFGLSSATWMFVPQHKRHHLLTSQRLLFSILPYFTKIPTIIMKCFAAATLALALATSVHAYEVLSLTRDNYDSLTDGKTVFIKFFAPWVSLTIQTNFHYIGISRHNMN
jgi:hypothetical protein